MNQMQDYKLKVGLEIHVYPRIENKRKLFCNCKIDLNAIPNTNICPVCTAQPGSKPMLPNREALLKTLAVAMIFNAKVNGSPAFQRKHYSWPDLPSGYQRTMSGSYSWPVAVKGEFRGIRLMQVHLEEDPAKWDPETGRVDYNRSGTPLIEIVTEPDFGSPEQVKEWLHELRLHLDYAGCFDERFGIKADVNVSISPEYERVEIKNINSFSSIYDSIVYEYKRQCEEKEKGSSIPQQTMTWTGSETVMMREKETAVDYKFIPEQDLPRAKVDDKLMEEASKLSERRPSAVLEELEKAGVSKEDASIIYESPVVSDYTTALIAGKMPGDYAGKFMRQQFLRVVNYAQAHPREFSGSKRSVLEAARLFWDGKISDKVVKQIMEKLFENDFDVEEYVSKNNLSMVSDDNFIEGLAREAIDENPSAVSDYKDGKVEVANFLAGQVMRKSEGKADIRKAKEQILKILLEK